MRKAYVRIKIPEELADWVYYIADQRLLGYRSMIEFTCAAVRGEIQRLRQAGFLPPAVPKVRDIPRGSIGKL